MKENLKIMNEFSAPEFHMWCRIMKDINHTQGQ